MNEPKSQSKGFLPYIHHFRGFAILLIVGLHTATSFSWNNPLSRKLIVSVANNGTVLFVFIAGFLFYHLFNKKFDYQTYLRKKLLYVILPYLIISIFPIIDKLFLDAGNHWWMNDEFDSLHASMKVLYMLATGRHFGVLWFIPMISIFYLLAPFILAYSKLKLSDYITPIICIAGLFTVRFGYHSNILLSFIHFFPIYLFGIWVSKRKGSLLLKNAQLTMVILSVYIIMTTLEIKDIIPLSDYISLRDAQEYIFVFNISKLKAMLLSFGMTLIFFQVQNKRFHFLEKLGDYSFGIFFLHLYFINVFRILLPKLTLTDFELTIITYAVYLSLVTGLCLLVVRIIKHIFKARSRLIIGS
ncbi:MAG: acyltransferase [Bacteroidota bacterium]